MKRILSLAILLFVFSYSLVSAEMISGFNTYSWGTPQSTIDERVILIPLNLEKESTAKYYVSVKDSILDENGKILFAYNYGFIKEKLISGSLIFFDKSKYERTVREIIEGLPEESSIPKAEGDYPDISHYLFKDTRIMIQDWNDERSSAEIVFLYENTEN